MPVGQANETAIFRQMHPSRQSMSAETKKLPEYEADLAYQSVTDQFNDNERPRGTVMLKYSPRQDEHILDIKTENEYYTEVFSWGSDRQG
jgi:hypothetical protein